MRCLYLCKYKKKKRKTENGKRKTFKFFGFRLEWENGTDARSKSRGCLHTMPCKKEEKPA